MGRSLISPGKYIQGAGVVRDIGTYAAKMGARAFVLGGRRALSMSWSSIASSFAEKSLNCCQNVFGGTSSRPEINRLKSLAMENSADMIVVVGGGMAIDAGKVVAHELKTPVIVVPTIATTNAPCSAMSVIYSDNGDLLEYMELNRNPDCVLVDTCYIVQSPARFLVAGMGDALATYWEADTCIRSASPHDATGTVQPTLTATAIARLTYETLLESGLQAKLAVERNVVTPAVEAIVEANTLSSGLGFENLGHAGAHSVHNGLLALKVPERRMHGEIVAFGVLVQLVLEGRSATVIREVQAFCQSVGLPLRLEDLGIKDPNNEDIRKVAKVACSEGESIHATWFPVMPEDVEAAIWTANALGDDFKRRNQND